MGEPRLLDAALKVLPGGEFNSVIRYEWFRYDPAAAPRPRTRRMTFLGTFKSRDAES